MSTPQVHLKRISKMPDMNTMTVCTESQDSEGEEVASRWVVHVHQQESGLFAYTARRRMPMDGTERSGTHWSEIGATAEALNKINGVEGMRL